MNTGGENKALHSLPVVSRPETTILQRTKVQNLSSYAEKYQVDIQTGVFAILASVIVMIAEFGSSTFVSDLYHMQLSNVFPKDAISADARFIPGLLFQTVFHGTHLPSVFLLMLVASLVFGGLLLIIRMNFLSGRKRILPLLLLVLHPFLFAHSAYIVNRLQTSCAVAFAALAAFVISGGRFGTAPRIILSGVLLSLSLMSYQPAIGIFLVSALFLYADALIERNLTLKATIAQLINIALAIGISIALYESCVFLVRYLYAIHEIRVHNMMALPASIHDIQEHINDLLKIFVTIMIHRTQFFPIEMKWLLLANMAWLTVSIYRRGQGFARPTGHVVFLIVCFLSFYFTMFLVYPVIPLPRIMPGLAFAWFFVFLLLLKYGDRIGRSLAMISVVACVVVFSVEFNIMHERSAVKNEIDKQITWQLVDRIQRIAGSRDEHTVVALVGTLSHRNLPYWKKYSGVYEGTLHPDIIQSVYDYDWSKYRLIEFYCACREPDDTQRQEAKRLVADSPLWPEEGSVIKGDGFIAVALSRP